MSKIKVAISEPREKMVRIGSQSYIKKRFLDCP